MKNQGKIIEYEKKDGTIQKAISYNADQLPQFKNFNKLFIHLVDDNFNVILDPITKKKVVSLINISKIKKVIGFTD